MDLKLPITIHDELNDEVRLEVDVVGRKYSLTPRELLELKGRAAKLFSAPPGGHPAAEPAVKTGVKRGRK